MGLENWDKKNNGKIINLRKTNSMKYNNKKSKIALNKFKIKNY